MCRSASYAQCHSRTILQAPKREERLAITHHGDILKCQRSELLFFSCLRKPGGTRGRQMSSFFPKMPGKNHLSQHIKILLLFDIEIKDGGERGQLLFR